MKVNERKWGDLAMRMGYFLEVETVYIKHVGWVLGTMDNSAVISEESEESWNSLEEAESALYSGQWGQRKHFK